MLFTAQKSRTYAFSLALTGCLIATTGVTGCLAGKTPRKGQKSAHNLPGAVRSQNSENKSANISLAEFHHNVRDLMNHSPREWGEVVTGVKTRFKTDRKEVALTLDACGAAGDGLDDRIVSFLERKRIPATFFVTSRWIKKHPTHLERLKRNRLFDLENHGFDHRPASVNGRSVYGITGTSGLDDLYHEVEDAARFLKSKRRQKAHFFRSGTAYYDELAVRAINRLGYEVVGFDVLGDAGATYPPETVVAQFKTARPGSIIIAHVNRPEKQSGAGVPRAIAALIEQGYQFVKLRGRELLS